MNTTEVLLRGDADVNQVNVIWSMVLYWLLIGTSSTQEPRCSAWLFSIYCTIIVYVFLLAPLVFLTCLLQFCRTVWLLLKNDARIFQGNTNGPLHMAAFQNICPDINPASMIPCKTSGCDMDTWLSLHLCTALWFKYNSIYDSERVELNGLANVLLSTS